MNRQSSEAGDQIEVPTLVQINEFEKDNKKFQLFKDKRKRTKVNPDRFCHAVRLDSQDASCSDINVVTLNSHTDYKADVTKSQEQPISKNRFLRRSSPKLFEDSQASLYNTLTISCAINTEKSNNCDPQKTYNQSRNQNVREEEDDMVEYADSEKVITEAIPSPTNSERVKQGLFKDSEVSQPSTSQLSSSNPKKFRRDRNMRMEKNPVSDYMKRPVVNLYARNRTVMK